MPAYNNTTAGPILALYPGDTVAVWSAEAPAVGTASRAINIPDVQGNPKPISVEIVFSAAPGTFEIDIQDADTDVDAAYQSIPNAIITTVNATGQYARYELSPFVAKFVRLIVKTAIQNVATVTLIARISR